MGKLRWFVLGIVAGLSAAAIGEELKRPQERREWKGTIAGVPYNFRLDEWSSVAKEYWNPASDSILTPHAIGLGWGINFAAVLTHVRQIVEPQATPTEGERAPERQNR
jgi:hypothetical protein